MSGKFYQDVGWPRNHDFPSKLGPLLASFLPRRCPTLPDSFVPSFASSWIRSRQFCRLSREIGMVLS